ncbi:hypothetical protein BC332_04036 [Capsicum chinense]|nr:hypothetical protein BC332_04036 [Capsicum chinense]
MSQQSIESQIYAAPPQSPQSSKNDKRGLCSNEIVVAVSATVIVFVLSTLVAFYKCIKKQTSFIKIETSELPERNDVTVFNDIGVTLTYEKIVQATRHFSLTNCIGNGGFGSTYKAEISTGLTLAIKRLLVERCQGVLQFNAEIRSLDRANKIFNYKVLYKIAMDIALAISFLHDQCVPRIIHRDIKPSNILLDNEQNAYLSDFGLSRIMGIETSSTTAVAGTFGYVAPEYAETSRVSDKADVYSYGIVLLELLSDKRPLDPSFSVYENGFNIVSWANMLLRNDQAHEFFYTSLWEAGPEDKLMNVLHLALMCTVDLVTDRLRMRQVVEELKDLAPLVP